MKPTLWLRLAALLLLLFAAGHTAGFLTFRPDTAEGLAVWNGMNSIHFQLGGSTFTYGGFYRGFGLFITVFDLFLCAMALFLAQNWRREPSMAAALTWGLAALHVAEAVLSLLYFAAPPVILSVLLAVCCGIAALGMRRSLKNVSSVA